MARLMFLNRLSPRSVNVAAIFPVISSSTLPAMATPPGGASASSLAATLMPSPKISSSCTTMSPRLMPMRSAIGASREAIASWTPIAHRTASTAESNSTNNPSPVVLKMRPPRSMMAGSRTSVRTDLRSASVAASSASIMAEKPTTSATRIAARRRVMQGSLIVRIAGRPTPGYRVVKRRKVSNRRFGGHRLARLSGDYR